MFLVERVRFKNFRSYGNQFTEIELSKNPCTVITAPNGSGKSTILMAIEFALFGKVSNGIKKGELISTVNRKEAVVEIECQSKGRAIKIVRGIKPDVFEIVIDGELVDQEAHSRDYQAWLENDILGFNLQAFRQVVSINGSTYTPFLMLSKGDRRKMVDGLLDLTIFTRMSQEHLVSLNVNKERLQRIETEIVKLTSSIESLKKGLEVIESQSEGHKKAIADEIAKMEEEVARLTSEVEGMKARRDALLPVKDDLSKKTGKLSKMEGVERDFKGKLKDVEQTISFFEKNCECPTCQQTITDEHKTSILSSKGERRSKIVSGMDEVSEVIRSLSLEVEDLSSQVKEIDGIEVELSLANRRIADFKNSISRKMLELEKSHGDGGEIRGEIKATSERLESVKEERLSLLEEKQYLDLVTTIIKDNGIKSSIIAQYIPHMNREINRYLELLNVNIGFSMDEGFNETILARFKDEVSFQTLSAGERARVELAILFTWRELAKMKNSLSCNLLLLDEIFDAVLDADGINAFVDLLKNHLPNTNVFLITHRPEVIERFDQQISIKKVGNFSTIE